MNESTWTIQKVLEWSIGYMKKSESSTPRLDCELLLAHILKCKRIDLYVDYFKPLSVEEREGFKSFLKRRFEGEPVAYILGYRDFWEHRFIVNPSVLIPRPDSEHILDELAKRQSGDDRPLKLLDIGFGSGCLSISADLMLKNVSVTAWDVCSKALDVASANSQALGACVDFQLRDALLDESWEDLNVDIILSNPPYISRSEIDVMSQETLMFEPEKALFTENNGLLFYEKIADKADDVLAADGYIIMEIGYKQAEPVRSLFSAKGWKSDLIQDLSGHDRVVIAYR